MTQLTHAQMDAIGYVGGGILAICLIPQVAKVMITRSARDISITWSLLYSTGLVLSLSYLILKDAPAAWIPIIFEIAGCLFVLFLKLFYEHTVTGRRYSAAKQQQHQQAILPLHGDSMPAQLNQHIQDGGSGHGGRHGLTMLGQAAAAAVSGNGDISWRGTAVLGQHQQPPPAGTDVPMIDCSIHDGSRYGGGMHGGSVHGGSVHGYTQQQQEQPVPGCKDTLPAQPAAALEVKCMGTSLGSCSNSSSTSLGQEGLRGSAGSLQSGLGRVHQGQGQQQQQQQPPPPLEPLFASTWVPQPARPISPVAVARTNRHQAAAGSEGDRKQQ